MHATIIYFSSSGNTAVLADRLATTLRRCGCKVLTTSLDEARSSDLREPGLLLIGSPAWSGEQVVPAMQEFLSANMELLPGKRVGFFGTYDWGDGKYFDGLATELRGGGGDVYAKPLLVRDGEEPPSEEELAEFVAALGGTGALPTGCRIE